MEFRKEKSEKSKELIRKQYYQSDILNIGTGYYKKENILPVTGKPNEHRSQMKEFVPQYKELKPNIRLINDLLSHRQKLTLSANDIQPKIIRHNTEVQELRGYNKLMKDNCFDERGNFSARKRYRFEFFGKEKMNKIKTNKSFSQSIKDKRNSSSKNFFKSSLLNKKNGNGNWGSKTKRIRSSKNIFANEYDYRNIKKIEKTPKKSNDNNINNYNFKSPENTNKYKNNMHFTKIDDNKLKNLHLSTNKKIKEEKKNYPHPKNINKEFYTKRDGPVKSNRITKEQRDTSEKEYFNIEIKNVDNSNNEPIVDQKKLKQIFLKNGLHLYDFNDDGMNVLFKDKKIEAKLRKNKKDENFDKNYRNVVRELNKINVKVNRCGMINDTGFINNNAQRKRKGTPGKNLLKNKDNKDQNTKLNTGFAIKRDKYIMPQSNINYKNGYNYKTKVFNHNKK